MNFIAAKIILSLLVIKTAKCEGNEGGEFIEERKEISRIVVKWFKNIVNPKYPISNKIENEALENSKIFQDLPPIFTSAERCDDPGARWDYKFVGAEKKRKLKPGLSMNISSH